MAISLSDLARKRHQAKRLGRVLAVLARHGFGHLIHQLNLQHLLPSRLRAGPHREEREEAVASSVAAPQRLRMVLEEWGPTAVKFGQLLATRPDLLPDPYLMELRKLADSVPPFDATEARRIIEAELGKPVTELFREFDAEPIAAGSIAQAHTALLHSGEPVVIKVKRPSVEEVMLADLDLLEAVIVPLLEWLEDLRPLQPAMLVREFRRSLRRELDFVAEASITRKIRADLAKISFVRVPLVYWNLTTSNVLTLQRLSGVRLTDSKALAALKVDCKRTARQIAEVFLSQFFMTGLFHADPHPGNLLLTEDGGIALLDFGMAGRLDRELRSNLATTLIALVRGDLDMIVETYMDIGVLSDDTDIAALKTDVHEILDKYYGIPARCININRCLADIMTVARTHNVLLPRDFVMLCKSFCTMVMLARELDPEFDLSVVAKSFAASLIRQKLSPVRLGHDAVAGFWGLSQTLRRLPREIRTFARKLASGKLQFQVEHHVNAFEGFARELDRATNRLAFSVIVGSIVIGSALILHARVPPYLDTVLPGRLAEFFSRYMPQTSVLGLGGFLFAGVLGLLLAIAIWRHGRL